MPMEQLPYAAPGPCNTASRWLDQDWTVDQYVSPVQPTDQLILTSWSNRNAEAVASRPESDFDSIHLFL